MMVPVWLVVVAILVMLLLGLATMLSYFAWAGAELQRREAVQRTKLLQIDVVDARSPRRVEERRS